MYIMKHIKNVCRKNELFKTWFIGWLLLKTWIPWNFKILQVIQRNLIKIRNKLCNRQLKNIFLLYLKLLEAKLYLDHLVVYVLLGLVANHLKCNHWESPSLALLLTDAWLSVNIFSLSLVVRALAWCAIGFESQLRLDFSPPVAYCNLWTE